MSDALAAFRDPTPVASLVCAPADVRSFAERVADSASLALTLIAAGTFVAIVAYSFGPRVLRFVGEIREALATSINDLRNGGR